MIQEMESIHEKLMGPSGGGDPLSRVLSIVFVTLDKPRELRISGRALLRFKEVSGIDLATNPERLTDLTGFCALVWALARETDESVTLEQLAPFIGLEQVLVVASAVRKLAGQSSPRFAWPDAGKN